MRCYKVMSFGLGGNHGHGISADGNQFTSSWYARPEDFQRYICAEHYKPDEMEGCILIDKIGAIEKNFALAYKAPLCNPKLTDDARSRFQDKHSGSYVANVVIDAVCEHQPMLGAIVAAARTNDSFVGLDDFSPAAYAQWWREHGARIGVVRDGRMIWEAEPTFDPPTEKPYTDIPIRTLEQWDTWAIDNAEGLLEQYATLEDARLAACGAGIMLGGGAAPLFFVHFVEEGLE